PSRRVRAPASGTQAPPRQWVKRNKRPEAAGAPHAGAIVHSRSAAGSPGARRAGGGSGGARSPPIRSRHRAGGLAGGAADADAPGYAHTLNVGGAARMHGYDAVALL